MKSPHRILVPVDFSESARAALDYAILIGAQVGAKVDVLHVWRPPEDVESRVELFAEFAMSDTGHTMVAWLASVEQRCGVKVHGRLAVGDHQDVPGTIVQAVEGGEYDLVIMGTHEHRGFWRFLKGSIGEKVVRSAPCPVVMVRAGAPPPRARTDNGVMSRAAWAWPS